MNNSALAGTSWMRAPDHLVDNFYNNNHINSVSGSWSPSRRSNDYASELYAELMRKEYADYRHRYQPYEEKLMGLADSSALLDEQLSRITLNSQRQYDMARQNSALLNGRYGVAPDARTQQSNNSRFDADRTLAAAKAKNMSRLAAGDRRMQILSGSGGARQSFDEQGG